MRRATGAYRPPAGERKAVSRICDAHDAWVAGTGEDLTISLEARVIQPASKKASSRRIMVFPAGVSVGTERLVLGDCHLSKISGFGRSVRVAVVLTIPATFLSIATYLMCVPGHGTASSVVSLAILLTPALLLRAMPVVIVVGLVAQLLWLSRLRAAIVLLAELAGLVVGQIAALNATHVSPALALVSSAFAWATISACLLVLCDRKPIETT
jgi:hypothetical protein